MILKKIYHHLVMRYKKFRFSRMCPHLKCSWNGIVFNDVIDKGHDNSIIIGNGGGLKDCKIFFYGTNCTLHLGSNVYLKNNVFWFEDNGSEIYIGEKTTTEEGCQFAACEGKRINIGKDCMFSHNVDIRNTDSHSILNDRGERINPSSNILIGDHVWIGIRSTILKGCIVPSNSVIAAQSLVTKSLKAHDNSLIAGSPASVISTNIHWDRKRL